MKSSEHEKRRDKFLALTITRPTIMGILNLTPDSFSDGGRYNNLHAGVYRAAHMIDTGADIVDIGGESTRPKAIAVAVEQELERVIDVVARIDREHGATMSIDSYKAKVAERAIDAGAIMINDVWGLQHDSDMARVVAERQALLVIMHNRREIDPDLDILTDIREFFARSLEIADRHGIDRARIFLDPGIGFGKTSPQDLQILDRFAELSIDRLPMLVGLSRKKFIAFAIDKAVDQRLYGTMAANLVAIERGARIIRVHDVVAHRDAVMMSEAIRHSS